MRTEINLSGVSKEDIKSDSTLQSPRQLEKILHTIDAKEVNSILHIGCGNGGLSKILSDYYEADVTGIDVRKDGLKSSEIDSVIADANSLPFSMNSFDLVFSSGVIEHIEKYDDIISEMSRVCNSNKYVIIITPNLGSWINRISLLLGYQPRNIEISEKEPYGSLPVYDDLVLYHTKCPTYRALIEMVVDNNYKVINSEPLFPYQENMLVKIIDYTTKYRVGLSRRFGIVCINQSV